MLDSPTRSNLAITGRLIDAEEAHRIGLVSRVVKHEELLPAAHALASEIATQCSPLGVANAKRLVYSGQFTDLTTACIDEDETAIRMTQSDDFKEGIKAFMEKRAAHFTGNDPNGAWADSYASPPLPAASVILSRQGRALTKVKGSRLVDLLGLVRFFDFFRPVQRMLKLAIGMAESSATGHGALRTTRSATLPIKT